MRNLTLTLASLFAFTGLTTRAATVFVDSTIDHWQDTGVDVIAGQYLTVEAFENVAYSLTAYANASGVGNFQDGTVIGGDLAPAAIIYSLVGKVGGTDTVGTGTLLHEGALGKGPGFVGTFYNQQVPVSGRLYFGFNDSQPFFDNLGSYEVRFAVPEPSSLGLASLGAACLFAAKRRRGRTRLSSGPRSSS